MRGDFAEDGVKGAKRVLSKQEGQLFFFEGFVEEEMFETVEDHGSVIVAASTHLLYLLGMRYQS